MTGDAAARSGPIWRVLIALLLGVCASAAWGQVTIDAPRIVHAGAGFKVTVEPLERSLPEGASVEVGQDAYPLEPGADGSLVATDVVAGQLGAVELRVVVDGETLARTRVRAIPGWMSVLPPLIAILVALLTRNVVPALFVGIWFGAFALNGFSFTGAFTGLLDSFAVFVLGAVVDEGHASILLFSFMIGGMVGVISENGGTRGLVRIIERLANSARAAQASTGLLGLLVFFDDYANTLVVGNTMRHVTDRFRVSREKLAYIVDSTAAPVSCVAFVTTWIGFEVGLIGDTTKSLEGFTEGAYSVFLNSLPYSFYPWLAMLFVFVVALSGRDFGPMLRAERRARESGILWGEGARIETDDSAAPDHQDDRPERALNAVIPVLVLVVGVLVGLLVTGSDGSGTQTLRQIIGDADSYKALMWASLLAVIAAVALTVAQRLMSLRDTMDAWYRGVKSMGFAMVILILAWSLSAVSDQIGTAPYLVSVLGESLPAGVVPASVFVIAAAVAFATGTSWGAMGILIPLVVPLAWAVLGRDGQVAPGEMHVLYSTVACTLAGAVWGDHCSPISDTTILSSMASGCDHIDHVRTQIPYALLVGGAGLLLGTLPTGFGLPWWIAMGLAIVSVVLVYRAVSRRVQEPSTA